MTMRPHVSMTKSKWEIVGAALFGLWILVILALFVYGIWVSTDAAYDDVWDPQRFSQGLLALIIAGFAMMK